MSMEELTAEDIVGLEAALIDIKADHASGAITNEEYRNAKRALVEARSGWRRQEEIAGRRSGFVGGEAVREG